MQNSRYRHLEALLRACANPRLVNILTRRLFFTLDTNLIESDSQSPLAPPVFLKKYDLFGLVAEVTRTDPNTRLPRAEFDYGRREKIADLVRRTIYQDTNLMTRLDLMLGVNVFKRRLAAGLSELYVLNISLLTVEQYGVGESHGIPEIIMWNKDHPKYNLIKRYLKYLAGKEQMVVSDTLLGFLPARSSSEDL